MKYVGIVIDDWCWENENQFYLLEIWRYCIMMSKPGPRVLVKNVTV